MVDIAPTTVPTANAEQLRKVAAAKRRMGMKRPDFRRAIRRLDTLVEQEIACAEISNEAEFVDESA